jgi:hypothetical protein
MIVDSQSPFNTYMNMVTAMAVTAGLITSYFRDQRLAKGTADVATTAKKTSDVVGEVKNTVDATHVIVNAQKTAMIQKMANAQLLTLTMAQAMLEDKPNSKKLQEAVVAAQTLYDETMRDLAQKKAE